MTLRQAETARLLAPTQDVYTHTQPSTTHNKYDTLSGAVMGERVLVFGEKEGEVQ